MDVTIVAEQGSHLLIARGERYAVIERRGDRLYNCHDHQRASIPSKDLTAVDAIIDDGEWTEKADAEAAFERIAARGSQLAQRML